MQRQDDAAGEPRPARTATDPAQASASWAWAGGVALLMHGVVLQLLWPDVSRGAAAAAAMAARPLPEVRAVQLAAVPRSARPSNLPVSVPREAPLAVGASPQTTLIPQVTVNSSESPGTRAAAATQPLALAGTRLASAVPMPERAQVPASAGAERASADRRAAPAASSLPPGAASMPPDDEAGEPLTSPQALRELALRPLPRYAARLPDPFKLRLSLRRGAFRGEGELTFDHDLDGSYRLQLHLQGPSRPMWEQSSSGRTGAQGLEPGHFADRRRGRRIGQAQFDREQGEVRFGTRAPTLPLAEASQDRLSWLVQLGAVLRADPALRRAGAVVWLPIYSARGDVQLWRFENQGERVLALDESGPTATWLLTRTPERLYDTQVEVWLDPVAQFQPARILLTHWPSGDRMELDRRGAPATP